MDELNPNTRVLPFELISPLFTDYAEKARFIWVPENVSGTYNDSTFFALPIGTILIKNFYFPDDFRKAEGERRIIETRLSGIVGRRRLTSGWQEAKKRFGLLIPTVRKYNSGT